MFFLGESTTESEIRSSPTTISDWLGNPAGSHTRHVGARYSIIDSLKDKFYKEIINNKERFARLRLYVFKTDINNVYDIIVKIPSLSVTDVSYDVLLRVGFLDGVNLTKQANVLVYCNSPSWVFTYAYLANKYKVIHPLANKLLTSEVLNNPPKKVNPDENFGFDSVVTFALIFITLPNSPTYHHSGIRSLSKLSKLSDKDLKSLKFDSKFEERQHSGLVQAESIKKEAAKKRLEDKKRQLKLGTKLNDVFKKNRNEDLFDAKDLFKMKKK